MDELNELFGIEADEFQKKAKVRLNSVRHTHARTPYTHPVKSLIILNKWT